MNRSLLRTFVYAVAVAWFTCGLASAVPIDETPPHSREWGFRPADGAKVHVTPPGFSWRPQEGAVGYELQCAQDATFSDPTYAEGHITYTVHCPPRTLPPGRWYWRFRFHDASGLVSDWSSPREFDIVDGARELPLPPRSELLARVPTSTPGSLYAPNRYRSFDGGQRPT